MAETLISRERRLAVLIERGERGIKLIRFDQGHMRIEKRAPAVVFAEFEVSDTIAPERVALAMLATDALINVSAKEALINIVNASRTQEQRMATIDVKKATTQELLAFYNANSGKDQVKRFADRSTAEKRVNALLLKPETFELAQQEEQKPTTTEEETMKTKRKQTKAKKAKPTKPTSEATAASISKSIKASWKDAKVAAKRSARHHVKVGGEEYKSVREAFVALKLPLSRHVKFRAELKASGRKVFEGHTFTLVEK